MSERAKESLEKQLIILNNKNDALKKQLKNQALALATWQKALGVAKDEKDAESRFLTSRKNWKNSKRRVLNKQVMAYMLYSQQVLININRWWRLLGHILVNISAT